jgi:acetyl-CoA carboxylase biotin carboxylase subunit
MIRRLLVANRGEIAARIVRTCRQLGIETVLAVSEADAESLPARLADRIVPLGPAPAAQSYLDVHKVVAAAVSAQADALHPGYGFLSENPALARACDESGITFVGPAVEHLQAVGDKLQARHHALAAGLPLAPGGEVESAAQALELAGRIGWPVLIKAVGGGGGRGLKLVSDPAQLRATLDMAMAEAQAAFGDPRIYVERFVSHGRHVEVQIIGDGTRIVHLGDRDCSVQRRYQKLVEEAPAPALADELRAAMHRAAIAFGRHLRYRSLGTVEFLVDCERGEFYFLEMNARIQVEHPVTEAVTGFDLVAEQIAIAEGRGLRIDQDQVHFSGHAIECRINAEDPAQDFRPGPGTVSRALFPAAPRIRIDTHVESGAIVPPHYDSLLAKVIVHGDDRADALARLRRALADCRIEGVPTNLEMHRRLLNVAGFIRGGVDTAFLPHFLNTEARAPERTGSGNG